MTDFDPIWDALREQVRKPLRRPYMLLHPTQWAQLQADLADFDASRGDLIRAGNSIGKTSHAYPVVLKRRVVQSWVVAWLAR